MDNPREGEATGKSEATRLDADVQNLKSVNNGLTNLANTDQTLSLTQIEDIIESVEAS